MKLWPSKKRDGGSGTGDGRKRPSILARLLRARFDAAQTTKDNARHWGAADFLSADAEADPNVRKILRTRARYEVQPEFSPPDGHDSGARYKQPAQSKPG